MTMRNERADGGTSETFVYEAASADVYQDGVFALFILMMTILVWSRFGVVHGLLVAVVGAAILFALSRLARRGHSDIVLDDVGIRRIAGERLWYDMHWSDIERVLIGTMHVKGATTNGVMFTIFPVDRADGARKLHRKIVILGGHE
jgi:hypothetical protein